MAEALRLLVESSEDVIYQCEPCWCRQDRLGERLRDRELSKIRFYVKTIRYG